MAKTKLPREAFLPLCELSDDDFITDDHLARVLNVSVETIRRWRRDGQAPDATLVGPRLVRYRVGGVRVWVASRTGAAAG